MFSELRFARESNLYATLLQVESTLDRAVLQVIAGPGHSSGSRNVVRICCYRINMEVRVEGSEKIVGVEPERPRYEELFRLAPVA